MDFIIDFLSLDLQSFDKFGTSFPVGIFLTLLLLALAVSTFFINYHKMQNTEILQKLLRKNATSADTALTLKELRIDRPSIRQALTKGGKLTFIVKKQGDTPITYEEYMARKKKRGYKEEKTNFDTARFYIDPEQMKRAESEVYHGSSSWLQPIIITLILCGIWFLLAMFTDDILAFINSCIK